MEMLDITGANEPTSPSINPCRASTRTEARVTSRWPAHQEQGVAWDLGCHGLQQG